MENVDIKVTGGKIVITIDADYRGEKSASGKSTRVASTCGNQTVPGTDIKIGLNAYVKGN